MEEQPKDTPPDIDVKDLVNHAVERWMGGQRGVSQAGGPPRSPQNRFNRRTEAIHHQLSTSQHFVYHSPEPSQHYIGSNHGDAHDEDDIDEFELIKSLTSLGSKVNSLNIGGASPLIFAIERHNLDLCLHLISVGIDVNTRDEWGGATPLHLAVALKEPAICEALICAGADLMAREIRGQTPLHAAAVRGFQDACKVLIMAGADVKAMDVEGSTPLHLGTDKGHLGVCKILVSAGADIRARDMYGRTPMDIANEMRHQSHSQIVEFFSVVRDQNRELGRAGRMREGGGGGGGDGERRSLH